MAFTSKVPEPDTNQQSRAAIEALDRIGDALREQGLSLDVLIESGRMERSALLRELYRIDSTKCSLGDSELRSDDRMPEQHKSDRSA
jgi:hypothetical protein